MKILAIRKISQQNVTGIAENLEKDLKRDLEKYGNLHLNNTQKHSVKALKSLV